MPDIRETITTTIKALHANTWLIELPAGPNGPDYPAIVFRVDSEQEEQWCHEGGYDQHSLLITFLSRDADWFNTIVPLVTAAVEQITGFMFEDSKGDGEYEDDPDVFVFFIIFRLRTPRY